jgi:hypothetical protein
MTPIFTGTIREGKLQLSKLDQFEAHLHTLEGKIVEVTVEKLTHPRTNNQNRYYWGCVVAEIAKHTGHDPEQIHELLKQMWSPKWSFERSFQPNASRPILEELPGIPTSTTRLDTLAFVEYTEKCRTWANEFLGLQIPLPGEFSG